MFKLYENLGKVEIERRWWEKDLLFEKLGFNRCGAFGIITVMFLVEALRSVLYDTLRIELFGILCVAFFSELWFLKRYGKTEKKRKPYRSFTSSFRILRKEDNFFPRVDGTLILSRMSENLPCYPIWPLCFEAFLLAGLCFFSGKSFSLYFALFLYFSTLSEFVIDTTFNKAMFALVFFSLLVGLFLNVSYVDIWPLGHLLIIAFSLLMTAIIIHNLWHHFEKQMKRRKGLLTQQVKKTVEMWKEKICSINYESIEGGHRITLNGRNRKNPAEMEGEDVVALLPYCLRHKECGYRGKYLEETSALCQKEKCNRFEGCDLGFVVNKLEEYGVFWRIIGHGHDIEGAFSEYNNKLKKYPEVVMGLACVNSFIEQAEELLRKDNIKEILYVGIMGFELCPSNLWVKYQGRLPPHSGQVGTSVHRESFDSFMSSVLR